jgi:itaconate CoA-transferase
VICDISGYGHSGPYRDKKAYDLLIQAEAGLLSMTGTPDQVARAGISVADIAAGMYAYSAILAALIQRGRTGLGSHIDVSMLEALTEWMGNPMYYAFDGHPQAPRAGASHPSIYPYGPFSTGDGQSVLFGLQNEREWVEFCEVVMGQPELATDERFATNARRSEHRDLLKSLIEAHFSSSTADEVVQRLDHAHIGNGRVNTMADLWSHPQLQARERWMQVGTPGGSIPALRPPATNDQFDPRMQAVPALGQHSESILLGLGYSDADIAAMRQKSII